MNMLEFNWIGLISALATFLGVWLGHVLVRRIERNMEHLWIPSLAAAALGLGLEAASLYAFDLSPLISAGCGILGVTLLWDAHEFFRQQKRVKHGYAPANLHNPRHARILENYPAAATFDWLDRDPRGRPYSVKELQSMREVER
jgi:hypothetical protein